MLIMHYADSGNLHNYLQTNFINITWNKKLDILWNISLGLNCIHEKNFIHRDFHSGNILLSEEKTNYIDYQSWFVGDLGLSQPANNALNNDIYGVIPYIAPEVFKDVAFSKEADIYSMGMIMWELTTGCKPFANVEHDVNLIYEIIDGKRPEITEDTPKCFANLMKRCWDSDPLKRPSIFEIEETVNNWILYNENFYNQQNNNDIIEQFKKAEIKRLELIQSEKLGPEFNEKSHPGAIYTSRPLSILISNSSSTISLQGMYYI
ncbi:kinase-like domain-containing protein [Glomus cerebriforme]|uniref:Kinase-like domain-containing protein n=1 Tax=Glomus cerebriforme TaxID=658196 RepID=A0A397SV90_9GLOM|nr:kinase-like domain-containing protein [Glomus cerebriforme]